MTRPSIAFASGLLFALGLGISGMTIPAKVANFLDVTGRWDPSLAVVMAGAVGVFFVAYRVGKRRAGTAGAAVYHLPTSPVLDAKLLGGAALFGIGWALGGYCPGPAIVASGAVIAGSGSAALVFVGSMLAGMALFEAITRRRHERDDDCAIRA